jgi:hypothetical protein
MADPKYTLNRTGAEVAEAIEKALKSVQAVKVKDAENNAASAYSAKVIDNETLELFAVTVEADYETGEETPGT